MSFEKIGINSNILSALKTSGFVSPTPVQEATIPQALSGKDLIVSAQTGSGKTAAFMLPILQMLSQKPKSNNINPQVLVLTPTRELALQITKATASYGINMPWLRIATIVGGMPYRNQIRALSKRVDILVATPGRLIDQMKSNKVSLTSIQTLVLDEADRMLDMGFIEDIETIVKNTPRDRQTMLFSATIDESIARLAKKMMNNPQHIALTSSKQKHDNITQKLFYADNNEHKVKLLNHVLNESSLDQAIIFTSTKKGADKLAECLSDNGFSVAALHGDMNQRQRTRTISQLQKKQIRVLVATDIAARGIDINGISHAVNFDLPMQAEDYVHRIGRTGRAGRNGSALSLVTNEEKHKVRRIEKYIGQTISTETIEGLEPKVTRSSNDISNKRNKHRVNTSRNGLSDKNNTPRRFSSVNKTKEKMDTKNPSSIRAASKSNNNQNRKQNTSKRNNFKESIRDNKFSESRRI
ncbi:ATP-dependent RNA helicase [Candidatus Kinetoplastibacterium blastocrithidii TCC012E]|uniref:ATP-dependent RNA helicase n=1 Tax=Candidatus Kinetoplastidibacterium blastocrithidiae TCC012E TaxID=1208922 RepID=M1M1E7_9PROT|nr:DEAD/DEAH box helicase [Candidatus Kinetoplastibacterium blastocrithidii]AFZ83280.1 ATP-dependent RNA helicase [Candidatus Kinetoplastibacterium blastocrithidii (ex Strigomonas culicis)]AGF50096.1 ATP-dependent RNA helicase [Candidatus Kinetoplastibacterium blastocrithidii TCC012E]